MAESNVNSYCVNDMDGNQYSIFRASITGSIYLRIPKRSYDFIGNSQRGPKILEEIAEDLETSGIKVQVSESERELNFDYAGSSDNIFAVIYPILMSKNYI